MYYEAGADIWSPVVWRCYETGASVQSGQLFVGSSSQSTEGSTQVNFKHQVAQGLSLILEKEQEKVGNERGRKKEKESRIEDVKREVNDKI
jgi:hypothetical protein